MGKVLCDENHVNMGLVKVFKNPRVIYLFSETGKVFNLPRTVCSLVLTPRVTKGLYVHVHTDYIQPR